MAHINFDGLNLRITLTRPEKCASLRGDLVVPRACLRSVEYAPVIWDRMQHGITPMGVGYQGMVMIGAAWTPASHDFCVLGRGGPGLVICLAGNKYDRLLLSVAERELWPLFYRLREVTTAGQGPATPESRRNGSAG